MNSSPDRRVLDVSRPVSDATACWPGDTPCAFELSWKMSAGASVNVGKLTCSVHTATHCGPAWVVDVRGAATWQSRLEALDLSRTKRVLFRTGGWPDTSRFPDSIPVMERSLPDWLAARGVALIGVDVPSVDDLDSKALDNHHALGKSGIAIVEGLWLDDAPEGRYEFVGLPLKLVGADGSPLRAVLIASA
jgi:arylformamidase